MPRREKILLQPDTCDVSQTLCSGSGSLRRTSAELNYVECKARFMNLIFLWCRFRGFKSFVDKL